MSEVIPDNPLFGRRGGDNAGDEQPRDCAAWRAVSAILDELLDADSERRAARLKELQRTNPPLADEVAALLSHQPAIESERFLEGHASERVGGAFAEHTLVGRVVGDYTLERPIGHGGMGTVWLARRSDGQYDGRVAIKFLNWALLGSGGAPRLRREANALAKLAHPNITHLIDAGVSADHQPYLVLEYVEGEPIDLWCDRRALDPIARLRLLQQVLAAVSHSHGRLILHRDLKPSNILVTADGRAKLLDFGIAKLLESDAGVAATQLTADGGQGFTPEYAAPEQLQRSEPTTATDVYALGVLLYVLLTGTHPTTDAEASPVERLKALMEREPRRMSEAVLQADAQLARARGASPSQLARLLRGDLENIAAKALEKEPAARYQTVEAFAGDLQRYLNHEPVSACADSLAYRTRKFMARHVWPVTAATMVLAAILIGSAVSIWQAREATLQRDRALTLSARNGAIVDFVNAMLTQIAPDDGAVRVDELLERSHKALLTDETDPEHQAAILELIAEFYLEAHNPAQAQPLLDRAIALSGEAALKATLICNRGYALLLLNQFDAALAAFDQGIALSRVDPLASARCLQKRGYLAFHSNDPDALLRYAREAQARLREAPGHRPDFEASLMADIAWAHYLSGRMTEANRYYADTAERYVKLGRAQTPAMFSLRNNWGVAHTAAGDYRRALENYDEALRIARQRNPDGDLPAQVLANRAAVLVSLGRYEEAFEAFDVALSTAERADHVMAIVNVLVGRAGAYLQMGDSERAARELADIAARYDAALPPDSSPAIGMRYLQSRLALVAGQPERALPELTKLVEFFDERQMRVATLASVLQTRAEIHLAMENIGAAQADARRALDVSRALQDAQPHSSHTGRSLLRLAQTQDAAGAHGEARETAGEAWKHLSEMLSPAHPDALSAQALAEG